jgi:hypothetical protein
VHAANDNDSWITVSNETLTFSLLDLQDVEAVLSDATLPIGKYTQIRIAVTKAVAIINNQSVALVVPSSKLRLVGNFDIEPNKTSLATIDFLVDKSVKQVGDKYMLKPVIKLSIKTGVEVQERTKFKDREEIRYSAEKMQGEKEIDTSTES